MKEASENEDIECISRRNYLYTLIKRVQRTPQHTYNHSFLTRNTEKLFHAQGKRDNLLHLLSTRRVLSLSPTPSILHNLTRASSPLEKANCSNATRQSNGMSEPFVDKWFPSAVSLSSTSRCSSMELPLCLFSQLELLHSQSKPTSRTGRGILLARNSSQALTLSMTVTL